MEIETQIVVPDLYYDTTNDCLHSAIEPNDVSNSPSVIFVFIFFLHIFVKIKLIVRSSLILHDFRKLVNRLKIHTFYTNSTQCI